jgi:hypothetical protein
MLFNAAINSGLIKIGIWIKGHGFFICKADPVFVYSINGLGDKKQDNE